MTFDWVNILATVIVVSIVVTVILAVVSYAADKIREARRPKTAAEPRSEEQQKTFFAEAAGAEPQMPPRSSDADERIGNLRQARSS
ncbi:MAG TPA: hypothetical protein VL284_19600 [Thermoanaerobaculia bacterium]|nr:hypothetical protein [Thermoanaerobaculia bacterium]